jgi:hypothetical protein
LTQSVNKVADQMGIHNLKPLNQDRQGSDGGNQNLAAANYSVASVNGPTLRLF